MNFFLFSVSSFLYFYIIQHQRQCNPKSILQTGKLNPLFPRMRQRASHGPTVFATIPSESGTLLSVE